MRRSSCLVQETKAKTLVATGEGACLLVSKGIITTLGKYVAGHDGAPVPDSALLIHRQVHLHHDLRSERRRTARGLSS